LIVGFFLAIVGIYLKNYYLSASGIFFYIIWLLLKKCQSYFENEFIEAGIFQKWTNYEPKAPKQEYEPEIIPKKIYNFTSYSYLGSDDFGGVAHIQCNICGKWSVFPIVHVDGVSYLYHQLAIHNVIYHIENKQILIDILNKLKSERNNNILNKNGA
jgi:hypothetical protein